MYILLPVKRQGEHSCESFHDPFKVMKTVKKERIEIKYVINTHSHFDNSGGNNYFRGIEQGKPVTFINCSTDT